MENILIGNTFSIRVEVEFGEAGGSLSDDGVLPILLSPSGKPQRMTYEMDDTAITINYLGTEQKELGVFSIVVIADRDGEKQEVAKNPMAFRLVATAEEATTTASIIGLSAQATSPYYGLLSSEDRKKLDTIRGVDTEVSTTSRNMVENQAITNYVDRQIRSVKGLTIPINGNPMTITHNMDRYPSVTVAVNSDNSEKEEVEVDVTYIDRNTVRVGWDVEESIEGFVYIV